MALLKFTSKPQHNLRHCLKPLTPRPWGKPPQVAQQFFFLCVVILEAFPNLNLWQKKFWPQSPRGVVTGYPIFRPLTKVKTIFPPAGHIHCRNGDFSSNISVSHKYWGDSHKKIEKISFFIRNQETSDSTLKIHKKISYGWNFAKNWIEPLNRWDFNMER